MTRDDVLNLAREAGFRTGNIVLSFGDPLPFVAPLSATNCIVELEKFAALVAAAEREACAHKGWMAASWDCEDRVKAAILARGQK